jgi:GNAT superfamily N-acetyltransferase
MLQARQNLLSGIGIYGSADFKQIARKNISNWGILLPDFCALPDIFSPLPLINPHGTDLSYHVILKSGVVIGVASVKSYVEPDYEGQKHYDKIMGIDVRKSFRNAGLGRHLLRSVFSGAVKTGSTVEFDEFTELGKRFALPLASKLHHQEFPDLKIFYAWASQTIDGQNPYRVEVKTPCNWKIELI